MLNSIKWFCCCIILLTVAACGGDGDNDYVPQNPPTPQPGKDGTSKKKAPAEVEPVSRDDLEKAVAAVETELVATDLKVNVAVGEDILELDATMRLPKGAAAKTDLAGALSIKHGEKFFLDIRQQSGSFDYQIEGFNKNGYKTVFNEDNLALLRNKNSFRFIMTHKLGEGSVLINSALYGNDLDIPKISLSECALMLKCARTLSVNK